MGLGGKATITNRGASLKGFVKNGERSVLVTYGMGVNIIYLFFYGQCKLSLPLNLQIVNLNVM